MSKIRISCGPSGIMITKSTATVNWSAASISSRNHSESGLRRTSSCDRSSGALIKIVILDETVSSVKRCTLGRVRLPERPKQFSSGNCAAKPNVCNN
jgi:hypothetical protein